MLSTGIQSTAGGAQPINLNDPIIAKTSDGTIVSADQATEKLAVAVKLREDQEKRETISHVSAPKAGVAFATSLTSSNFVTKDGRILSFKGNEMIVQKTEDIQELRDAERTGAPIWEIKVIAKLGE